MCGGNEREKEQDTEKARQNCEHEKLVYSDRSGLDMHVYSKSKKANGYLCMGGDHVKSYSIQVGKCQTLLERPLCVSQRAMATFRDCECFTNLDRRCMFATLTIDFRWCVVRMFLCVVCVFVCVSVNVRARIHVFACACSCVCTFACARVSLYLCVCVFWRVYVLVLGCKHNMRMQTFTRAQTHTCVYG